MESFPLVTCMQSMEDNVYVNKIYLNDKNPLISSQFIMCTENKLIFKTLPDPAISMEKIGLSRYQREWNSETVFPIGGTQRWQEYKDELSKRPHLLHVSVVVKGLFPESDSVNLQMEEDDLMKLVNFLQGA